MSEEEQKIEDEFTDDCCPWECFIWPSGEVNHCEVDCHKNSASST